MVVRVKRAYDPPSESDGSRYLIDGLWPRGVRKPELRLTEWLRELAPSAELRKWFGHDPGKYALFRDRYRRELEGRRELVDRLAAEAKHDTVTIVFGARDADHSNASVLKELLDERARGSRVGFPARPAKRVEDLTGSRRRPPAKETGRHAPQMPRRKRRKGEERVR